MKAMHFKTTIRARPETVWKSLTAPEAFSEWSSAFAAGSYYEGSWDKGAAIRFLTPEGDGMSSVIAESRPYEFIAIEHLGGIKNGVPDMESEEARKWAHAHESYRLTPVGDATELDVDMDIAPDYEEFMSEAWPKALAKLKALCER